MTDSYQPLALGRVIVGDKTYWVNAEGGLIPEAVVKTVDKLQDELVRKIIGFALPLSAQVARFRAHSFDDIDAFVALLEQEYQSRRGGSKGNLTFTSYDGLLKIVVAVSDTITFGPELQVAKGIPRRLLHGGVEPDGLAPVGIVSDADDLAGVFVAPTEPQCAAATAASTTALVPVSPSDYEGNVADRSGLGGLEAVDQVTMVCVPDVMAAFQQGDADI